MKELRSSFVDNAKVILIFLVVLGHLMSDLLGQSEAFDTVYMIIYSFHMPAFIYLTGALSKKCKSLKQWYKLLTKIVIPYIVFQVLYTIYYQRVYGERIEFDWLMPRMALWFLISLFAWKLLINIVPKTKWSIVGVIIVSLLVGNVAEINDWASLSRTFYFFVYFVAGYTIGFSIFENRNNKTKYIQLLGVLLASITSYWFLKIEHRGWYLGKQPYLEVANGYFEYGEANRLVTYIVGFLMLSVFLYLVPKKEYWFTKYGQRTLAIYLFHMFIVKAVRESSIYEYIEESQQYWLLLMIALIITVLFSMKFFQKLLSPVSSFKNRIRLLKNAS